MPRGTANCTCRTCGKKFTKDLYESGAEATKRLREKIEWAESGGITECTDCWKARKRAEEKAQGLTCEIRVGDALTEPDAIYAIYGGDTYSHKDALKGAGCLWTDNYPAKGALTTLLARTAPRPAWVMKGTDPQELVKIASDLGAASIQYPDPMELQLWASMVAQGKQIKTKEAEAKAQADAEAQAQYAAELAALGAEPDYPDTVRTKLPSGTNFNGVIDGEAGAYYIVVHGRVVHLTDDEAAAMTATYKAWIEWLKKKAAIDEKYGA